MRVPMNILLLHPQDNPENGPRVTRHWDRVIDLGIAGKHAYMRWSEKLGCAVTGLNSLRHGLNDFRHVRDLLGRGCGHLIDGHGLDWWEILSILIADEMEAVVVLQRLAESLSDNDNVYVSRPCLHGDILKQLLGARAQVYPLRQKTQGQRIRRYFRMSNRLSGSQMIDIFWDKYDVGYQFRSRFSRRRQQSRRPVVLLPTAYVNVSRTGVAYANMLPQEDFLLLATRRSGWMQELPPNVAAARLSSYASLRDRSAEIADIEEKWRDLRRELMEIPELQVLNELGYLTRFSRRFRQGIEIRDAWSNVLDNEPVKAVFCADDSNAHTRIPLLLARQRGLPTIACHHGALDGQNFYKRLYADSVLAKGAMEKDYLVRSCGVPAEKVRMAAPVMQVCSKSEKQSTAETTQQHILFISEPCEVAGGRAEEFYRDVLPPLADLALRTGRKLIVKLHPAESKIDRAGIVARVLRPDQQCATEIVDGPLTEELLAKAWFGITVLSTVATECAVRGIPCFLCRWLDFVPYGYLDQFIRFGVGVGLSDPQEIAQIPEYIAHRGVDAHAVENFWQPATAEQLKKMLTCRTNSLASAAS
jgi:hypothetical protein